MQRALKANKKYFEKNMVGVCKFWENFSINFGELLLYELYVCSYFLKISKVKKIFLKIAA